MCGPNTVLSLASLVQVPNWPNLTIRWIAFIASLVLLPIAWITTLATVSRQARKCGTTCHLKYMAVNAQNTKETVIINTFLKFEEAKRR